MGVKRPLGLGKKAKQKKQKTEESTEVIEQEVESAPTDQLTVELNEEVNPDDPLSQLFALFNRWEESDKDSQLILNGIIHECDRILRNLKEEKIELNSWFYCIYAISLADLALFNTEESDELEEGEQEQVEKVGDFFDMALEEVDNGLDKFPNSSDLLLTKSKIILRRIPLEYISKLTVDSVKSKDKDSVDLYKLLKQAIELYQSGIKSHKSDDKFINNKFLSEILDSYDDLLDIVDNFGKDNDEGLDSDDDEDKEDREDEDEEDDEDNLTGAVELQKNHPLYKIQNDDSLNLFWREETIKLHDMIDEDKENKLYIQVSKKLGQSYLLEAEEPSSLFMTLKYSDEEGDNNENEDEIENLRKISIDLISKAMSYLQKANDKETPQSWVDLAECEIQLGNMYEVDSEEQEKWYAAAEKRLTRANNATHGKYEHILQDLKGEK